MLHINDHSGAEDVDGFVAENAGGQQIKNEPAALVHNGMTGVVAALITDDNVIVLREKVDHTAFAFVTPVYTYYGC